MQQRLEDTIKIFISASRLAFMQGRYEESLRLAKQALDIDRKNSDAHQCAGNAYMSREDIQKNFPGKYDKSIQQAQKYLDSLFKAGKL